MPNRLAHETSPYLRQHADNPVDWYPWGEEALARARAEDKPILLSIGYSACHWCHVMAHESFEDAETARLMNERFVCVKVDREEMPDVDQIYQQALMLLGEGGGWPLTMFLAPDGAPFFGGTYFPKDDRFGRPSFRRVLLGLSEAYRNQRDAVAENAQKLRDGLRQVAQGGRAAPGEGALRADSVDRAAIRLSMNVDLRDGGFDGAPKFPNPKALELLLRGARRARAAGETDAEVMQGAVLRTLLKMAEGGIYDQLGGGFARYATDARWLVPHFEKMLYDNAQLLTLYAEGYQLSREETFARVLRETAAYLERELCAPEGGFYTAQDADSEGVEGKYYVWTLDEVRRVAGAEAAAVLARCYEVAEGGNWNDPHGHGPRGASILHAVDRPRSEREVALLAEARARLFETRRQRVAPGLDDKVLASSNGLAIAGLAEAGRVLGAATLVESARRAADFVLERMVERASGRLYRTFKAGVARLPGTLEDHAFVADGLLVLSEALGPGDGGRYLAEAIRLTELALRLFYDERERAFYMTAEGDGALVQRPVSNHDGAIPSGMSVCLENLIRLGDVCGERRWIGIAEEVLAAHHDRALANPFGYANLLNALDLLQERPAEIVLAGRRGATVPLERAIAEVYVPNRVIVFAGGEAAAPAEGAPARLRALLEGKVAVDGKPTAYLCRDFACRPPITDAEVLRQALAEPPRRS